MSAGEFVTSKYQANNGDVYSIRVQQETLDATIDGTANEEAAGDVDQALRAKANGSAKSYGMNARRVRLVFTGDPPEGYGGGIVSIPIMRAATFEAWSATPDLEGTYLGEPVKVVGFSPERFR